MSVPKSMQRIKMVVRGRGTYMIMKKMKGQISGMFEARV